MVTGSCLCGAITYRIEGELDNIQICHCSQCRKAQGGPFATNIPVATDKFVITDAKNKIKGYESLTRKGKYRMFCSDCGSPLFSHLESDPNFVRVRAGTINDPVPAKIKHHQFVSSKASWYEILDTHQQHKEFPLP